MLDWNWSTSLSYSGVIINEERRVIINGAHCKMSFDDEATGGDCDGIDFKWMRDDSDSFSEDDDWNDREG